MASTASIDAAQSVTYLAGSAGLPSRRWRNRVVAASAMSLGLHLLAMFIPLAPEARPDAARPPLPLNVRLPEAMPLSPRADPVMPAQPAASATRTMAHKALVPRSGGPASATARSAAERLSLTSRAEPDKPELIEPRQEAPPAPPTAPVPFLAERYAAAYLSNPAPAYPAMSRRLGEQGSVVLVAHVGPRGDVGAVEVNRSSGYPRLDEAAVTAVERWRFVPAREGDVAVESTVLIPLRFSLGK